MRSKFGLKKESRLKLPAIYLLIVAAAFFAVEPAFSKPRSAESFSKTVVGTSSSSSTPRAETYLRTELYFGRNKPDGSEVSETDWDKFLETEVTTRFPDGYTILEGAGHFRDKNGKIIVEKSKVLVLLYPARTRKNTSRKIERIRRAYKQAFQQQSVLRLDFPQSVRVLF